MTRRESVGVPDFRQRMSSTGVMDNYVNEVV
jgi:hypothetical protein